jgi:large subunit ribosomal protein L21
VYAVIKTGGKQYRVAEGDRLTVERLDASPSEEGADADVSFAPLLVVDGDRTLTGAALSGASVAGRVVGMAKGPKIAGFKYRAKSRGRKQWGHRQHYSLVEITGITTS